MTANPRHIASWRGLVRRRGKEPGLLRGFTTVLFGLFLALLLAALLFGVTSYQQVTQLGNATEAGRGSLGMLVNTVRGHDGVSSVTLADDGKRLVLEESIGADTFETAIFLRDGMICQQTTLAGSTASDASVIQVVPSAKLEFSYSDGLLTITTDQGQATVFLRSHEAVGMDAAKPLAPGEVVIL